MNDRRHRLGGWAVWTWGALVLAFGLAASCYSDTTNPKYIPPSDTSTDTNNNQGLVVPSEPVGEVRV